MSQPDSSYIRNMFDRLAPRYDLFNHLTSAFLATGWRARTLDAVKPGMKVLDLGCGTGDLSLDAVRMVGEGGEVIGLDFSSNMLAFAGKRYERLDKKGAGRLRFLHKKAEELPTGEAPFDIVVSGFVLRNIYENIDAILEGVKASLKPGGRIRFLDITKPRNKALLFFWKIYMHTVVAFYGKLLFGKDYPAFYLTQSAERFLDKEGFSKKLAAHGFRDVNTKEFMGGVVTLYDAEKP